MRTSALCVAAWILLLGLFVCPAAMAQNVELDVVVLVDVSASMNQVRGPSGQARDGNDREGLRWDAVKLVCDLLDSSDRIAVLPFNEQCPAESSRMAKALSSLTFAHEIQSIDQDYRQRFESLMTKIVGDYEQGVRLDDGQTGLLNAIGTARQLLSSELGSGRRQIVILLTDGQQQEEGDTRDEALVSSGQWKKDARVQFFATQEIPIFTFALGERADREFLSELSGITRGGYVFVEDNSVLVEAFRRLVFSLQSKWEKRIIASGKSSLRSLPLGGATDIAVFGFEESDVSTAKQKRSKLAPNPVPKLQWVGGSSLTPERTSVGVKLKETGRHTGYWYTFFDGQQGSDFDNASAELLVELASDQERFSGYFVKRLPIRHELQLEQDVYFRHEPIRVEVKLKRDSNAFSDNLYEVVAFLFDPNAELARAGQNKRFGLPVEGQYISSKSLKKFEDLDTLSFQFELDASSSVFGMNPLGGVESLDQLEIKVVVREIPGLNAQFLKVKSLQEDDRTYQYALPSRTVRIKNAIPLVAEPGELNLKITDSGAMKASTLLRVPERIRLPGSWKLESEILPPSATGKRLDEKDFRFNFGELRLSDGSCPVELQLTNNSADSGMYGDGRLRLFSANSNGVSLPIQADAKASDRSFSPLEIPLAVRLERIKLLTNATPEKLVVGKQSSNAVTSLRVRPANDRRQSDLPVDLRVWQASEQAARFDETELWLEGAAKGQKQSASISLGGAINLRFQPNPDKHGVQDLVGIHEIQIEASGPGYETAYINLLLEVEEPQFTVTPEAIAGYSTQGYGMPSLNASLQVNWLKDAVFQSRFSTASNVSFRSPTGVDIPANCKLRMDEQELVVGKEIPFQIELDGRNDQDLQLGIYESTLNIRHPEFAAQVSTNFRFAVDTILLLAATASQDAGKELNFQPDATKQLVHFFEKAERVHIQAKNAISALPLDPQHLIIRFKGDVNTNGNLILKLPDERGAFVGPSLEKNKTPSLEHVLVFPAVTQAFAKQRHIGELEVIYEDPAGRKIGPVRHEVGVTLLDANSIIRQK